MLRWLDDLRHACSTMVFLFETLSALIQMPEQSLPGLVLGGFGNRVRVVLIVDKKCVITNFDCPDALTTAAVTVNIFECSKVHLLLFQDAVVA